MPLRSSSRDSVCLFCASAARSQTRPRLLPRVQTAFRSTSIKIRRVGGEFPRSESPSKKSGFLQVVLKKQLDKIKEDLQQPDFLNSLQLTPEDFEERWTRFSRSLDRRIRDPASQTAALARQAAQGKNTLESRLRHLFYAQAWQGRFTAAELENQKAIADLRYPAEWYPSTRQIARTVHLHVGPTNSGKTYHALKRLEEARSGIYLGPLRLLAHEVYTRLNAKGKPCALVTGEEQRMPDGEEPTMFSCTVEMAPLNVLFDVAVIDEIQMINHTERGWAWTQAFLGLRAREVHLCGEARTVPLIRELCALAGDKVEVHEYKRLTPLKVQSSSIDGKLSKLQKGDCVVCFTVLGIHALRRDIEKQTGRKCAMVYGSLPPETRAQQARLFNDPDNDYDFLVASDAIGMGLNLAIKRVILETTWKHNGRALVPLEVSEIKQIAGRAGRFKTAHQAVAGDQERKSIAGEPSDPVISLDDNPAPPKGHKPEESVVGYVTTFASEDLPAVQSAMRREPADIRTAGLFPPSLIIERFASYFPPGTPFSYIMLRLHEISDIHPRFHMCSLKDQLAIADAIHPVKNLSVIDRIVFIAAPTNMRAEEERKFLRAMAECVADGKTGSILDLPHLPLETLDKPASGDRAYLYSLEQLHKMLVLYLWLSFRFPNVFRTRALANYTKQLVEDKIEHTLKNWSLIEQAHKRQLARREQARKAQQKSDEDTDDISNEIASTEPSSTFPQNDVTGPAEEALMQIVQENKNAEDASRTG